MEPELPLGRRGPHTTILQLLLHLRETIMRLLPELDPDQRDEGFPRPAATLPLPPNFFVDRRVWRFDTSSDWWDRLVMEIWDDQDWLRNFRMRKTTFQELCTWLAPALQRQDTHLRPAIPLEKRVAIALWKLATPDSYRSVGHQFGVGRSTVGAVLMEVVRAINSELLNRLICLPDLDSVMAGFAALGFPNCGGALDGTHIAIRAPPHRAAQFINRKGYFSMVLQALVDHRGQFSDICVGWSGRAHDARIFRNSYLYRRLQAGTFFPHRQFAVGDVHMPVCIVADAAYPLMPWLMKPYTGQ
uniref:DDE Tnp4 domain-containing protein n=2 Tax=Pelodiscus sinensis TaxID=13735 RepID=K7FNQ2_PELSI